MSDLIGIIKRALRYVDAAGTTGVYDLDTGPNQEKLLDEMRAAIRASDDGRYLLLAAHRAERAEEEARLEHAGAADSEILEAKKRWEDACDARRAAWRALGIEPTA